MKLSYWKRIAKTVCRFARLGDTLRCIRIRRFEKPSTCELCGHHPIHWVHTLQNSRTRETLSVGSECITNYAKVHEKRFGTSADIRYPSKYAKPASFLNKKFPGTVAVEQTEPSEHSLEFDWEEMGVQDYAELSVDDFAPEGMGFDEVDWDSFDWEQD